MKTPIDLSTVLADAGLGLFALVNLGVVYSLENSLVTPADATEFFFNFDNCEFVHNKLLNETADEIMGRGVQLADLFDALTPDEASEELQRELGEIRSLCTRLLSKREAA